MLFFQPWNYDVVTIFVSDASESEGQISESSKLETLRPRVFRNNKKTLKKLKRLLCNQTYE